MKPHTPSNTPVEKLPADRFFTRGVKKLFSLAKTKIRLAMEAETVELQPTPASLVKRLSGVELATVDDAARRRDVLKTATDFESETSLAHTTVELMDIIECVKYRFEPPDYMPLVSVDDLGCVEQRVAADEGPVNLLVRDETCRPGVNLYVGDEPPKDALHVGRVPTTLSTYLDYAWGTPTLSRGVQLTGTRAFLGHRTLISHAVCNAVNHFGGERT